MTTIEERLARDIAGVQGGVVVTESDLWEARGEIDELIVERRQRDRRRTRAGAVAAAAVVAVAGIVVFQVQGDDDGATPSGPGPSISERDAAYLTGKPPTLELLQGVWRLDDGGTLVRFGPDGTVQIDQHGTLYSQPVATGTYDLAGDEIAVAMDTGPQGCAGVTFRMRASVPDPGDLRFIPAHEGDGSCSTVPHWRGDFEQVLPPTNAFLRTLRLTPKERQALRPPADALLLQAAWMSEGGGYVLELTRRGTYVVAGGSGEVLDHGLWNLDRSKTRLSLVSDQESPTCDPGDRLVLGDFRYGEGGTSFMGGTVEQNVCGGAWTPTMWFMLPNVDR